VALTCMAVVSGFGFSTCGVTPERPRRCEFTQFVTHHVFADKNRNVLAPIVHSYGQTNEFRHYRGAP